MVDIIFCCVLRSNFECESENVHNRLTCIAQHISAVRSIAPYQVHRRIGSSEIVVEDYVRQECSIWKKFLRKLYALGEHKHIGVSIIGKTQLECLSRAVGANHM